MTRQTTMLRSALLTLCCLSAAAGNCLGAAEIVELRVYPPEISLSTRQDRQSLIVQAVYDDGLTRDVTSQAACTLGDESIAVLDDAILTPRGDGQTQLNVAFEGLEQTVPVHVAQAGEARPVSFKLDVMPVFMKAGCNSGSCHGSARGKDGFRLSLFGYDPDGDYFRITREQPGRRIDLAVPEASLLVTKSVGAVPHTGGKRMAPDSELCRTLTDWIAAGTPADPADQATCVGIELYPPQAVLDGAGATQQVVVLARYSNGTTRDVTSLAALMSNNDSSAAIDETGLVTAGDRGESFLLARFDVHAEVAQFITLPKGLEYQEPASDAVNEIDELVAAKLKKLRLLPSEPCSDEEFLRRVHIDLTGLVPTLDDYAAFLQDDAADKRSRKIDELLQRPEFTELWVSRWAEWLMMRSNNNIVSAKSVFLYYHWLKDQIGANVPVDQMVRQILASSGGTFSTPQTTYYEIERNQLKVAENVAQVFMGMQIQCAQCHNHPFDRWTQDDYYEFAAFFSQIGRKRAEDEREQIIYNRGGGEVKHPVTGKDAVPRFLGGDRPDVQGRDRREVVADWLVAPDNPYFARNFANRIWQHFFGIGIVEPVDDVRISNPPTNPELLDELAERIVEYNYDFRQLVRDICNSRTYQRSTRRNESNQSDERNFAHQNIRRIKAESMLDIISQVTGSPNRFPRLPPGARAVQIADGSTSTYFLTTFGRATRETPCSCEVRMEPTLSQALHLLNGETVNDKIREGGLIQTALSEQKEPMQVVEQLYIACLTRLPTDDERSALAPLFGEGSDPHQSLEDIFWSLLNSREFLFNH